MNIRIWIFHLVAMLFVLVTTDGCKKNATSTPIITPPTISATTSITNITATTAAGGGNVTSDGGAAVIARGICWNTSADPTVSNSKTTDGTGTGAFTSSLTGLTAATTYYVRAYATNSGGTVYGTGVNFTSASLGTIATISVTTTVTGITTTTATSGGNITSDGGTAVTSRGVCWSTAANPTTSSSKTTDGSGTGMFTSNITGLTASTTYYVRDYAVNSAGTSYGTQVSFTSAAAAGVSTHQDSVAIGTQIWTLKNLDVTTYRNGDPIPQVTDATQWAGLTTGAWCYYDNDSSNNAVYGKLYNWYAVNDFRGLAPAGWHIPTNEEFTTLTTFLGGESVAGGKMKETGATHWRSPNSGATNESGFTGLPGGYRSYDGGIANVGGYGYWWTSTESLLNADNANHRILYYSNETVNSTDDLKQDGKSVRCVKN